MVIFHAMDEEGLQLDEALPPDRGNIGFSSGQINHNRSGGCGVVGIIDRLHSNLHNDAAFLYAFDCWN
jgi:hypothetical protein